MFGKYESASVWWHHKFQLQTERNNLLIWTAVQLIQCSLYFYSHSSQTLGHVCLIHCSVMRPLDWQLMTLLVWRDVSVRRTPCITWAHKLTKPILAQGQTLNFNTFVFLNKFCEVDSCCARIKKRWITRSIGNILSWWRMKSIRRWIWWAAAILFRVRTKRRMRECITCGPWGWGPWSRETSTGGRPVSPADSQAAKFLFSQLSPIFYGKLTFQELVSPLQ